MSANSPLLVAFHTCSCMFVTQLVWPDNKHVDASIVLSAWLHSDMRYSE